MSTSINYLLKEISEIIGPTNLTAMQSLLILDAVKKAKNIHQSEIESAFLEGKNEMARVLNALPVIELQKTGEKYYEEKYGL